MKHLILALALIATPAFAQQAPTLTPNEQALSAEMQAQQNGKLQCFARAVEMDSEIRKLQARVKELEAAAKPDTAK